MLKYLVVQLSTSSPSYCHYKTPHDVNCIISIDDLKSALKFSMKENLTLNVLYPDTKMPEEYDTILKGYKHVSIAASKSFYESYADVVVFSSVEEFNSCESTTQICIIMISAHSLDEMANLDIQKMSRAKRINIVVQDIETITSQEMDQYRSYIKDLSVKLEGLYRKHGDTQINILSDLFFEDSMANCNAGIDSISIAPNGLLYLCPAFYYSELERNIGSVRSGVSIQNQHLLKLKNAPICRNCDAFHCKRCIWLNKQMTGELNTPSREQCVMAHLERNESRSLLERLRLVDPSFAEGRVIEEIDYLDPFELISR